VGTSRGVALMSPAPSTLQLVQASSISIDEAARAGMPA